MRNGVINLINNIVVIGSGVMGRGIAYVSAVGGYHVKLVDIEEHALESSKTEINVLFNEGVKRNKLTEEQKKAVKDTMDDIASKFKEAVEQVKDEANKALGEAQKKLGQ